MNQYLLYVSSPLFFQAGIEVGNRQLRNQLAAQNLKEQIPVRGMHVFGVGYWNNRWKIQADVMIPRRYLWYYDLEFTTSAGDVRYSHLYYAFQAGGGYMIGKDLGRYNIYLNSSIGFSRNILDMRITNAQTQVDLTNLTLPQGFAALPLIIQDAPYVDVFLELCTPYKRHLNIGESFGFGFRYGLNQARWKAEGAQMLNSPADRSALIYVRAAFLLSVNREN